MEKIFLDKNLRKEYQKKSLEKAKDFDLESVIYKWENSLFFV